MVDWKIPTVFNLRPWRLNLFLSRSPECYLQITSFAEKYFSDRKFDVTLFFTGEHYPWSHDNCQCLNISLSWLISLENIRHHYKFVVVIHLDSHTYTQLLDWVYKIILSDLSQKVHEINSADRWELEISQLRMCRFRLQAPDLIGSWISSKTWSDTFRTFRTREKKASRNKSRAR